MKHLKKTLIAVLFASLLVSAASAHCGNCGIGKPKENKHEHKHHQHDQDTSMTTSDAAKITLEQSALDGYLTVQEALAADDLETAQHAAQQLAESVSHHGLMMAAHKLKKASDIKAAREAFHTISNIVIPVLQHSEQASSLYLAHCPMAFDNTGADWIQSREKLANPYFGSMMLRCGTIKPLK